MYKMNLPGWCMICCTLWSTSQKWKMSNVQFIFDAIFHDIFDNGRPSWHLICMLSNAFFTWNSVCFFTSALCYKNEVCVKTIQAMIMGDNKKKRPKRHKGEMDVRRAERKSSWGKYELRERRNERKPRWKKGELREQRAEKGEVGARRD